MLLIIDNYDSFTYNLAQYFGELGADLRVIRNDQITLKEIEKLNPKNIVISPGPGTPDDAGISISVIQQFAGKVPIMGVCLGHQSIAQAYGGKIVRAARIMHGKASQIIHDNKTIFKGMSNPFDATRYHSLIIEEKSLPKCLEISAKTDKGEIMGIRHKKYPIEGVQFHPESILTGEGKILLGNFLKI